MLGLNYGLTNSIYDCFVHNVALIYVLFGKHSKFEQGCDITLVNGNKGKILNEKSQRWAGFQWHIDNAFKSSHTEFKDILNGGRMVEAATTQNLFETVKINVSRKLIDANLISVNKHLNSF